MLNGCKPYLGKISIIIHCMHSSIFQNSNLYCSSNENWLLFQLVFECAVGIAVLVRCFVDRKATENAIIDRLGDGFSRPPFATVVVYYQTFCLY